MPRFSKQYRRILRDFLATRHHRARFGLKALVVALGLGLQGTAAAMTVSLLPVVDAPAPPPLALSVQQIAVVVADIGTPGVVSLGAYDLDVSYDPSVLAFAGLTFGDPLLGNQLDLSALGGNPQGINELFSSINFFEVSLDSPAILNGFQAPAFTVATLSFVPLAPGTTALGLSLNFLGNAEGNPLSATAIGTSITVVPAPAALGLLVSGLLIPAFRLRTNSRRKAL